MAPKKKGKKEKASETPEERAARLEKEAYEAGERAKMAAVANLAALRERQEREAKYSRFNGIKIHNQWRKIMRMTTVDALRGQIEVHSQSHERQVDRKDAIIQMLDRDLEDAEEQHTVAVRGHMAIVAQLLDLQYQKAAAWQAAFEAGAAAAAGAFDAERADIAAAHARHKRDMAELVAAMKLSYGELESDMRQEFEAQREEIKNKNSEEYNVMKITLESNISALEKKFEVSHEAYVTQTADHSATFRELTANDAQAARVIDMRMHKLQRLQDLLAHWRAKAQSNAKEWEERNKALHTEKVTMSHHYLQLKRALDAFRASMAERLKQLSQQAAAATAALEARLAKAEAILKLAERCRKLETEQEKILPFHSISEAVALPGATSPVAEVHAEAAELEGTGGEPGPLDEATRHTDEACHGVDAAGRPVAAHAYLDNFFRRYNKALLEKSAVEREAARLERENGDLRTILKQYLDGISVNEAALASPVNPLLVVNGRLQNAVRERDRARAAALQAAQAPAVGGG